jgi:hypothetical protein
VLRPNGGGINQNLKLITGIAAALGVFLVAAPAFWRVGASLGHIAGNAILSSAWIIACIGLLAAFFVPIFVATLASIAACYGIRLIFQLLQEIAEKIDRLAAEFSRNAKETAVDAGFVAVLGIVSALVAFQSTDDFLRGASTLKVLAAAAVAYAALKALMLIPVRSTQVLAAVLMLAIIGASIGLLNCRHPLLPIANLIGLAHAFWNLDFPRKLTACAVALLSIVSLLYPFTPKGWKRILRV